MKLFSKLLLTLFVLFLLEEKKTKAEVTCSSRNGDISAKICSGSGAYCCGKHRNQCCQKNSFNFHKWLMGGAVLLVALPIVLSGWCIPGSLCCLCCCDGGSESASLVSSRSSSSSSSSSGDSGSSSSSSD